MLNHLICIRDYKVWWTLWLFLQSEHIHSVIIACHNSIPPLYHLLSPPCMGPDIWINPLHWVNWFWSGFMTWNNGFLVKKWQFSLISGKILTAAHSQNPETVRHSKWKEVAAGPRWKNTSNCVGVEWEYCLGSSHRCHTSRRFYSQLEHVIFLMILYVKALPFSINNRYRKQIMSYFTGPIFPNDLFKVH